MPSIDFQSNPLFLNIAIYAVAAAVVWFAGFRISSYADVISDRTGLGDAFLGTILLAVVTSLPEVVTTITAVRTGNPGLALSNFFGSVQINLLILAVADIYVGKVALTAFVPDPVLLLDGALLIVLLGLVGVGMIAGEISSALGVGWWSVVFLATYLVTVYMTYKYPRDTTWQAINHAERDEQAEEKSSAMAAQNREQYQGWSWPRLGAFTAGAAALILAAGTVLAMSADAIAAQTGLGTTIIGATLLAAGTSLPEVSTVIATVRLGNYSMAVSNIFGSNAFMVVILFIADLFYPDGALLNEIDRAAGFSVMIGIVMTAVYLVGLIERRDHTFLRAGYDSWAIVIIYIVALGGLYSLSGM